MNSKTKYPPRHLIGLLVVVLSTICASLLLPAGASGFISTRDGGWLAQISGTTTERLYAVAFTDANHGWAVGEYGTICATTNGGATWSAQNSGSQADLYGVAFTDVNHGWAVGWRETSYYPTATYELALLATVNGGASWSKQSFEHSAGQGFLDAVAFGDATHGWAVGDSGNIFATTNGGATWSQQSLDSAANLYAVASTDANHAWAVGADGAIWATTNGGATWSAQNSGSSARLNGVTFSDATHGWAVGTTYDGSYNHTGNVILATVDGGATWSAQDSGSSAYYLLGVASTDAAHGWAVANGGTILVTTNGGVTWTPQSTGSSQSLNAVAFTDATHGWAVGDNGTILATAAGGWPDTTAPTTTVSGADALWHNAPVTVSFSAADNAGGSGVAKTEYQLGAGAWTTGTSLTVSGDGTHTINYRSTDNAGNIEAAKSVIVRVDTRKPTSVATKNVTVTKGRKAKLPFRITDPAPSCGSAKVTITIKLKKKVVKTITIANQATNKAASYTFKVGLKKGSYSWTVKATDIAGNVGNAGAAKKLTVK